MTSIQIEKVIDLWRSDGIKLSPPLTVELIKEAEEILSFQFPEDFKQFYLKLDGFVDWDWTSNMFSMWPLARIVEEYRCESDKNFIVFADYLINSHHLGFVKGRYGVFKNDCIVYELIAGDFSETVALINADSITLY
ncbi:MAG: SMI1/KNR4 family protein [Hymenobacter sp.]|nr:MAG: SMI1/KNR4 family protein [Hymenobacter sp.]